MTTSDTQMDESGDDSVDLAMLIEKAESGDLESLHALGKHYFECGDHSQAETWYLRSIELGNVDSMVNIGVLYFTDGDFNKAKYWYQHASDFGDSLAMYNMAVLLDAAGKKEESVEWYYKAIGAGDEGAEHNLRILLRELGRDSEIQTLDVKIKTKSHHISNLFLMLNPMDEVSEDDKEFNLILLKLQQFPDDEDSLERLSKLVDRNHDKARMASALKFISIGTEKEATYDLRHVDNVEDPEFINIINMLCSVDEANEPIQNKKITSEMAEFVLDQWEIISELDGLYWLDAFWTADITAELFLQGSKITDYEIEDFLFAYETLKNEPVSTEDFE
jgi:tetratricopeptide (TPR) repeat protein